MIRLPLIETWLADAHTRLRPKTMREYVRILDKHLLRSLDLTAPERVVFKQVRAAIKSMPSVSVQRNAIVVMRQFFDWCIEEGHSEPPNPAYGLKGKRPKPRERSLTEAELRCVWLGLEGLGDYTHILRLLILTGCRANEIARLQASEVKLEARQIELPTARCKNRRPHIVPLAPLALEQLPAKQGFLFGRGPAGFDGWKTKARLDEKIVGMEHWVVHDLRRTFVTQCNELELAAPHIIEAAVNHVGGHRAGVAGIYNRAAYLPQKRALLEAWAAEVGRIIGPAVARPRERLGGDVVSPEQRREPGHTSRTNIP